MPADADVIVIGAGHNALITAAYLARGGVEVLVLESADSIGGNTITEELTVPGFRHDSCSSAHVIIQSNPLMRDDELGLGRYGLEYVLPDPAVVMPFDDGTSLTMWLDRAATADEFARFSAADARAYLALLDDWGRLRTVHSALLDHAPGEVEVGGPVAERYRAEAAKSAWEVVHERFEHPASRAFVLWLAAATTQPISRPGTGILPLSVTAGRARFGWTTPIGGSQALPDALAALVADCGGRVVTSAHVERILVEGGRAAGVVTRDGRTFRAGRAVVSGMHATALPDAIGRDRLPAGDVARLDAWDPGLTLFAVHLALREPPRYRLEAGPTPAVGAAMGTPAGFRAQLDAFDVGRPDASDPWLLAVTSSLVDPSRVPDGEGATVKLLTPAPYGLSDGGPAVWDERREPFGEQLVARFARAVDGYQPGDELGREVESPLDLERRNPHNVRGSCHGGAMSPEQAGANRPTPGWSGYRLPVEGLYQTGATTHPGGSVSGRPGRNAARVVLGDLGIDPSTLMRPPVSEASR